MKKKLTIISLIFVSILSSWYFKKNPVLDKVQKPNIIFIMVDDLRPQLSCYGQKNIYSPNIEELANHSFIYENAICNYPVCGASRASMITGLRPNNLRFKTYKSRIDEDTPNSPTIGFWLKKHGYYTISNGKMTHVTKDSPESWSEPAWRADKDWRDYQTKENILLAKNNNGTAKAFEIGENMEDEYADVKMINKSIEDLKKLKEKNKPFFIGVGLMKPHLPFNAPKKYWDMYDPNDIQLATNRYQPKNSPKICMHTYGELRKYTNIPNEKTLNIPDTTQKRLIHGYNACVSYIDHEIGRLIKELKKLELYENSLIIIAGDHGWQLGEHNLWAKHANFQTSLKVPLIIKEPNQIETKKIQSIVELVDLFPTICDLCEIPSPEGLEGKSLSPINIKNPIDLVGFSKYHKGWSITTNNYSYTEWINRKTSQPIGEMFYDLRNDPEENNNVAFHNKDKIDIIKLKLDSIRNL
jgi:arylsulfatase A-like enzyme